MLSKTVEGVVKENKRNTWLVSAEENLGLIGNEQFKIPATSYVGIDHFRRCCPLTLRYVWSLVAG